jgi:hypothetical protein
MAKSPDTAFQKARLESDCAVCWRGYELARVLPLFRCHMEKLRASYRPCANLLDKSSSAQCLDRSLKGRPHHSPLDLLVPANRKSNSCLHAKLPRAFAGFGREFDREINRCHFLKEVS